MSRAINTTDREIDFVNEPPQRPSERAILHVDLDAFYASVEQRDRPELRGKPVVVGGIGPRSVVSAASYEARPFGVRSAMSMSEALRRCPHAEVVPVRMSAYIEASKDVFAIFREYTPLVEGLSLDEAFLDVTGSQALFGDAVQIAKEIRGKIRSRTHLTASAAVAPNKLVAKIASDLGKPDGLVVVAAESVREFLAPLPVSRMWGVGAKSCEALERLGIFTFEDLASARYSVIEGVLGSHAARAQAGARGEDNRPVVPDQQRKSIGAEVTFDTDCFDLGALEAALLAQTARVAASLARCELRAGGLAVKLKRADRTIVTRQKKLPQPSFDTDTLYSTARGVLAAMLRDLRGGVRLIGISARDLKSSTQRDLFSEASRERRESLERVTSALRQRWGDASIVRGTLVETPRRVESTRDSSPPPSEDERD